MKEGLAHSNIDAIYTEYPFLENILPRKKVQQAAVRRCDTELLDTPLIYGGCGLAQFSSQVTLLDNGGGVITSMRERWYKGLFCNSACVGEVLNDVASKIYNVQFIVMVECKSLVLYKTPRPHKNVGEWLATINDKKRAEYRAL